MPTALDDVLDAVGLAGWRLTPLKDEPYVTANWLAESPGHEQVVLRRYHDRTTAASVAYEHAVLDHAASLGWVVPHPVGPMVEVDGLFYCPTRFVPGRPVINGSPGHRHHHGVEMARLDAALRPLTERLGQREGWRAQHEGVTVHTGVDAAASLADFAAAHPRLGEWAAAAVADAQAALAAVGAQELPTTILHGDFAEWNVHYHDDGSLAGVLDFDLAHLDSRPYELAIARTHRSPETVAGYRSELAALGWPLTELEEAAIGPVYRAFRADMVVWHVHFGRRTGQYDLAMIESQLSQSGTPPPR